LILLFMVRFCSSLWEIIIFNLLALMIALVVIIITVLLFPCLIIISSSSLFLTSSLSHFQIFFAVDFSIQH
jgi:competence protein ComGF